MKESCCIPQFLFLCMSTLLQSNPVIQPPFSQSVETSLDLCICREGDVVIETEVHARFSAQSLNCGFANALVTLGRFFLVRFHCAASHRPSWVTASTPSLPQMCSLSAVASLVSVWVAVARATGESLDATSAEFDNLPTVGWAVIASCFLLLGPEEI